eukprot:scaffold34351_cov17-Prasinocladus_malaysianus.AAC.1
MDEEWVAHLCGKRKATDALLSAQTGRAVVPATRTPQRGGVFAESCCRQDTTIVGWQSDGRMG